MRRPWIACIALLAACGSVGADDESSVVAPATPVPTIAGVGSLPETVPATDPPVTAPLVEITRPVNADGELAELIGDRVGGNRLLMIGDSIFAGTETRYGGEMCAGLEPLGWAVEVAAEPGRFVEFGVEVVERTVPAAGDDPANDAETSDAETVDDGAPLPPAGPDDWDAAAVFLGSNYNGDQGNYDAKMRQILDRLAPRPTLLYTVTLYRSNYAEVNEVIEGLVADYPNVVLIDWAEAAKTPGVLRGDGLHPGDAGEQVLVELTAAALGDAPAGEAECIRSQFRDDSAIRAGNGSPNTGSSGSGGSSSGSTSGRTSSSSGGSSSSGSSSGSGGSSSGGTSSGSGDTTDGGTTTTPGGSTSTDGTTDSGTTDGSTDGGATDGSTDSGTTDASTDGGATDGSTDSGTTDGSTDGGATGGSTGGGTTTPPSGSTAPSTGGTTAPSTGGTTTPPSGGAGGSDTGTP